MDIVVLDPRIKTRADRVVIMNMVDCIFAAGGRGVVELSPIACCAGGQGQRKTRSAESFR